MACEVGGGRNQSLRDGRLLTTAVVVVAAGVCARRHEFYSDEEYDDDGYGYLDPAEMIMRGAMAVGHRCGPQPPLVLALAAPPKRARRLRRPRRLGWVCGCPARTVDLDAPSHSFSLRGPRRKACRDDHCRLYGYGGGMEDFIDDYLDYADGEYDEEDEDFYDELDGVAYHHHHHHHHHHHLPPGIEQHVGDALRRAVQGLVGRAEAAEAPPQQPVVRWRDGGARSGRVCVGGRG